MTVDPTAPVHPTFLYESIWCLAGFVILASLVKRRKFNGQIFLSYIIWYGLGRSWIEGLRTDSLLVGNTGLRASQLVAIGSVIAAAMLPVSYTHLDVYKRQTKDVLHQQYRLPLITGGDEVFELAQDLGALAVYISGAGPTSMAVVHKDDTEFFDRAEAALAADGPLHHFTVHRLLADNVGAVVS